MERLERQEIQIQAVLLVVMVQVVFQEPQVLQEIHQQVEPLVRLVHQELKEHQVFQELMEHQVLLD